MSTCYLMGSVPMYGGSPSFISKAMMPRDQMSTLYSCTFICICIYVFVYLCFGFDLYLYWDLYFGVNLFLCLYLYLYLFYVHSQGCDAQISTLVSYACWFTI